MCSGTIRVGMGGWTYEPWPGVFYPEGLAQTKALAIADFAYAPLRRATEDVPTGYEDAALDGWADKALGWTAGGRDVFAYFIAGAKVRNPAAAQALISRLG